MHHFTLFLGRFTAFGLLLLLTSTISAQGYLRLPSVGARIQLEDIFGGGDAFTYVMASTGDTMLWGMNCVKLEAEPATTCVNNYSSSPRLSKLYIHQNNAGQAFSIHAATGASFKLYDLSLQVGDTMWSCGFHFLTTSHKYTVLAVDTVTYADGVPRKRLHVNYTDHHAHDAIWVEGIGDILNGPQPWYDVKEGWYAQLCYSEQDSLLTTGRAPTICNFNCTTGLAVSPPVSPLGIAISPNPAHDRIRITQTDPQALHARLLALDGRVLGAWELAGAREMEIALPDVAAGMYLLHIQDGRGRSSNHRLRID